MIIIYYFDVCAISVTHACICLSIALPSFDPHIALLRVVVFELIHVGFSMEFEPKHGHTSPIFVREKNAIVRYFILFDLN